MSTVTASPENGVRRPLPMEVSNVLTAYWLGASLVALAVVAAFYVVVDAKRAPLADEQGATTLGWLLLLMVLGALFGFGGVVANGFAQGRPTAFQWIRVAVIVGIIVMLGALAISVILPMVAKEASAASFLGPAPVLGGFLLLLLAFLPFVFLILALSQSRSDAVREYFWPAAAAEEGAVAVEESRQAGDEADYEEEPAPSGRGPGAPVGPGAPGMDYRTSDEDDFAATQEMSPKAQGLIYVDHELTGAPAGSGVYGPESSGTRALEAAPEAAEFTAEPGEFAEDRGVVEQAEAEPPESIHDDAFTPSEPIIMPESGLDRSGLQPGSEADERLVRSDPVIMVPEEGPPRRVTMPAIHAGQSDLPGSEPIIEGSEPIIEGSEPIVQVPSKSELSDSPASELTIEEVASEAVMDAAEGGGVSKKTKIAIQVPSEAIVDVTDEGAKKKKKDTKIVPEGAQGEEVPPSAGTARVPGVKRPKQ